LTEFVRGANFAAWAQAIFLWVFAAVIYQCHRLVEQSNAILTHQSTWCGLNVNRLMDILGVLLLFLSLLFIIVVYTKNLSAQLTFLCLQYVVTFVVKALVFMVLITHTPGFTLKT
jgi:hypothetical protein